MKDAETYYTVLPVPDGGRLPAVDEGTPLNANWVMRDREQAETYLQRPGTALYEVEARVVRLVRRCADDG